jgi:N-acetyl-1-D-myo-inositol-2-amino-2-deoxy-alpha-D-glucopyranoside deacetylase
MPGLLAFHAHPDDESLAMGGTLARYAAAGEQVVVVTATRGEAGEVSPGADPLPAGLGATREAELRRACQILGVSSVELLGFRDSGMMGTPDNLRPDAFWSADFMEAVGRLVRLIRRYRPEVMTAYDPYGGYGHPDHIQVHRVGTAAFFGGIDTGRFPLADGEEPWQPAKLYWSTWPRERTESVRRLQAASGDLPPEEAEREAGIGTLNRHITTFLDVRETFDLKWEAIVAHRSQIGPNSWLFGIPEEMRREGFGRETFILVSSGVDAPAATPDLFAGLR